MGLAPDNVCDCGPLLRLRVLIVEDSWAIANSLKSLLERAGAHVIGPVPSVERALGVLRAEPVSLALVDMNLREAFADDVIMELIARNIPYIIVTAYESLPTDADTHAAGVLRKPVDEHELISVVRRFVAG
jgi:DNA-binding NtrC family response regulator